MEKLAAGLLEKTTVMGARRRSLRGEDAVDTAQPKELEYRYEKYNRVDLQLLDVGQYLALDPSTAPSLFLGVAADVPGYNAIFVSVSLEHQF
jgi:hypothetical protein